MMGYFNVKIDENWLMQLTYNFRVHSNERARRTVDILGWNNYQTFQSQVQSGT